MTLPVIALAVAGAALWLLIVGLSIALPIATYYEARDGEGLGVLAYGSGTVIIWVTTVLVTTTWLTTLGVGSEWLHWPGEMR